MSIERKIILGTFEVPDVEYIRYLENRIEKLEKSMVLIEERFKRHINCESHNI